MVSTTRMLVSEFTVICASNERMCSLGPGCCGTFRAANMPDTHRISATLATALRRAIREGRMPRNTSANKPELQIPNFRSGILEDRNISDYPRKTSQKSFRERCDMLNTPHIHL